MARKEQVTVPREYSKLRLPYEEKVNERVLDQNRFALKTNAEYKEKPAAFLIQKTRFFCQVVDSHGQVLIDKLPFRMNRKVIVGHVFTATGVMGSSNSPAACFMVPTGMTPSVTIRVGTDNSLYISEADKNMVVKVKRPRT